MTMKSIMYMNVTLEAISYRIMNIQYDPRYEIALS